MFARIHRSIELTKTSWRLLVKDKELAVLPVVSGLLVLVVCALFLVPVFLIGGEEAFDSGGEGEGTWWIVALPMYAAIYSVTIFFQAAVVAGATERMGGGDPTLSSALAAAWRHKGAILAWGAVAGTVGLILRSIQERSELVGRIVIGLVGAAWSLATFFVVPALVLEGRGVREAFQGSIALFRERWGEAVIGSGGISIAMFLLALPVIPLVALLSWAALPALAVGLAIVWVLAVAVLGSALQGIYVAVLYRYARTAEAPAGVDPGLLASAFRPRRR